MSAYDNVVVGRLKLKGKPLDVKAGGVIKSNKKKKKKQQQRKFQHYYNDQSVADFSFLHSSISLILASITLLSDGFSNNEVVDNVNETDNDQGNEKPKYDGYLTPAERCYLDQWKKIDLQRMAKMAGKSHRDRVQEFNQYLANLSEHYDIPKVGPG